MAEKLVAYPKTNFQFLENANNETAAKKGIAFGRKSRYNGITLNGKEVTAMVWEATSRFSTEDGEMEVRYFVTEPVCPENSTVACYGLGISSGETTHIAEAFCPGKDEAVRLAETLRRSTVTPVSFFDILEDYLVLKQG